ncbi:glycosyltransferase family 2 protein [Nocardioides sp. Bht2]|uniref:glycosyltransferase family 2 protein n=1 Tax=Nocardioides sp. Bht2 TaxID=3392297 RepID=UPI0039B66DF5
MSVPLNDPPRIVAVVVTYNRIGLVTRLVERLRDQPELSAVVVVDNASNDGTGAWLTAAAGQRGGPALHPVLLAENRGGAGGFHEGLRSAVEEHDAELIWLMDDDGMPEVGCLAELLTHTDLDFWGPIVVDQERPERLVFPIRLPGGTKVVHEVADVHSAASGGRLAEIVIPFNGVLVRRELARKIGYPRSEFFIWGDDHEYRLRAEAAGARIATVVDAVVRHPAVGELGTPMMFGRTTYNHSPSDLKHYCMARNNVVNLRDYRGWAHVAAFVVKTGWFYAFTRPSLSRLRLSLRGILAGLRGDFTGHRRFLR